jgi:hypothetical protein
MSLSFKISFGEEENRYSDFVYKGNNKMAIYCGACNGGHLAAEDVYDFPFWFVLLNGEQEFSKMELAMIEKVRFLCLKIDIRKLLWDLMLVRF